MPTDGAVLAQPGAGVRFDWGSAGAAELSRACAVLVVVDVLSFTTAVDIAVSRGMRVHPFPLGPQAQEYASRIGAEIAVDRSAVTARRPWSLSAATMLAAPAVPDLVLPSPNGSAICAAAAATCVPVIAACARNAASVARWLLDEGYGSSTAPVGVIAAGERWPDGTLRPCVEDLLGAAMVMAGLSTADGPLSTEAVVALGALGSVPDVAAALRGCVSGQELVVRGFAPDVAVASEIGVSTVVPVLRSRAFVPAHPCSPGPRKR